MANKLNHSFIKALTQSDEFSSQGRTEFNTPQTGVFHLTHDLCSFGIDEKELGAGVHTIQAAIRERNEKRGDRPTIFGIEDSKDPTNNDYMSFKELLNSLTIPQNPIEKMEKAILQLSKRTNGNPGNPVRVNVDEDFTFGYALDPKDFIFLLNSLEEAGYINLTWITEHLVRGKSPKAIYNRTKECDLDFLLKGWQFIQDLKKGNKESKQGFVACYFDEKHKKYSEAIVRGITNTNLFKPMIIRDEDYPETILEKGLGEIRRSRFVIADLSGSRHSVIFETGFAFGLGLDVIFVMKKEELESCDVKKEFYTKNYKIIPYSDEKELEEVVERAIKARIS